MRILFSVHLYPPKHNCGGEYYIHNMAKYLISKGHDCRVLLHQANTHKITKVYVHEGVEVFPPGKNMEVHFNWADRVFTHLEYTNWTIHMSRIYKKPCFFIVHNTHSYACAANEKSNVNIIYNSQAAADMLQYPHPSMVLHPPVDFRKFDIGKQPFGNKFITLINLNQNKGGKIFYEIARRMPERQFLAVKGSYDEQIIEDLPNVLFLDNSPNILPVYEMTRILIMPSEYESWGMTATEAMCNGIPVICTPTFGLKENCGVAGIYVERDDIDSWAKQIRKLDQKKNYLRQSEICRNRARELDPLKEYAQLEEFILNAR